MQVISDNIIIIDDEKPYLSSERMETPFGTRHSGSLVTLTQEHIEALQSGKTLLLDVEGEYVVNVKGEIPKNGMAAVLNKAVKDAVESGQGFIFLDGKGDQDLMRQAIEMEHHNGRCLDLHVIDFSNKPEHSSTINLETGSLGVDVIFD